MTRFILASLSPRRRELMQLVGYPFEIESIPVDENSVSIPNPAQNCVQTAQLKANALANWLEISQHLHTLVIAADTIVAIDGQMLGKPQDEANAREMLTTLRERVHEVHTGVSIINIESGQEVHGVHTAEVMMRAYGEQEITDYIATKDPLDKAGAYAIQDPQFRPVAQLNGCYLGVMGLSVCHLIQLLSTLGISTKADMKSLLAAHQNYPCPLFDKITRKHS